MGLFSKLFNKFYYYLTVYFIDDKNQKKYYYISHDQSIQVNDFVVVNANGEMKVCKVVETCVYSEKQVPYPVENTKTIVSKFDKQSLDDFLGENSSNMDVNREDDCGYYNSKTFFAKGFTNELTKFLVIENNKINKLENGVRLIKTVDKSLTLPDNLEYAELKTVDEYQEYDEYGTDTVQEYRSFSLKKLIIPFGYKEVDLSYVNELCELYISNGVRAITISSNLSYTMKTLYIPKDLEEIKINYGQWSNKFNVDTAINYLNFDTVFVDRANKNFKLENGILYYIQNDKKTIIWVSKNVKSLNINEPALDVAVSRSNIILTIKCQQFFENLKARFTKKAGEYSPIKFQEGDYRAFLLKFNKIILCQDQQVPEGSKLDNLIIDGSTDIIHGINATNEFFKANRWLVEGCKTDNELQSLLSSYKWTCKKNKSPWSDSWETSLIDNVANKDGFICYYKKKNGYKITSLVDLLGEDYIEYKENTSYLITNNERIMYPTYLVKNFVEIDRKLIDVNLYDEEYLNEHSKCLSLEDAKLLCNQMNNIRESLTHILGFRNFNLEFKHRADKVLFINMFSSEFSCQKCDIDGKDTYIIHINKHQYHNNNDPEGTLRKSNYLPDTYDWEGRHYRYTVIRYKKEDNIVEVLYEEQKHIDKTDINWNFDI